MKSRAQLSTEYLFITGVVFLTIITLFYYATTQSTLSIQMNQAEETVNTLASATNTVYALGPGAKKFFYITVPGGTQNISITNNEINIKMVIRQLPTDVFAATKPNLVGSVPTSPGTHRMYALTLDSGDVEVGVAGG